MELNRPLYYLLHLELLTTPGIAMSAIGVGMGLNFLRDLYHGSSLQFGLTLLMIMLTLVGSFMAFTGIILHSISRMINESKKSDEVAFGLKGLNNMSIAILQGTRPGIIKMSPVIRECQRWGILCCKLDCSTSMGLRDCNLTSKELLAIPCY